MDQSEVGLVDIVYSRSALGGHPLLLTGNLYFAKAAREKATTINGCECVPGWELKNSPGCSSEENAYCCNPADDPLGPWCPTTAKCVGNTWDRCLPRQLEMHIELWDHSTRLAELGTTSGFTVHDPFDPALAKTAILLVQPVDSTPGGGTAPYTDAGCVCMPDGRCSGETGWCCEGDAPASGIGAWCFTAGSCNPGRLKDGRPWDICSPPPSGANRAVFVHKSLASP